MRKGARWEHHNVEMKRVKGGRVAGRREEMKASVILPSLHLLLAMEVVSESSVGFRILIRRAEYGESGIPEREIQNAKRSK